ncbi:bifunctional riboflavin kinase/FAD synthetase [Sulfuritalea sp.]|uniref:bifunctional riboflavin kinase/FAD synthetase n=1 Tax=Sulfuritalea sp. TaxID=2480090 RepID=UPI00286DE08F|nr:bifunctional riboflavin kinase/FAD synthetase [Sulfuritalea sp.]
MLVFRGVPERATTSTVLTIGNFDGVHRGHRALLAELTAKARELALPATVLTFEPHPRELFAPDQAPARLASLRDKIELLAEAGVDRVHVCRFTRKLAALTAEQFIERILVRGLSVRHLIIGDDFRFGKGRSGDFALLQQAGHEHRFVVEAMHTVDFGGVRVSSSAVRAALASGNIEQAEALLGRAFVIAGRVMDGKKLGRTIGFPTANIQVRRKRLPLSGVYAVSVSGIGPQPIPGAANIGVRPTVEAGLKPVLEVHLLDFDRDIYGLHVDVNFLHKLRDEAKFDSLDALKAQIARDVADVRAYFNTRSKPMASMTRSET